MKWNSNNGGGTKHADKQIPPPRTKSDKYSKPVCLLCTMSTTMARSMKVCVGREDCLVECNDLKEGLLKNKETKQLSFPIPSTSSAAIRRRDSVKLTSTLFFSNIFIIMSCVRPGFSFSACKKKCFHVISILKLNFNRSVLFTRKDRKLCGHHLQLCSASAPVALHSRKSHRSTQDSSPLHQALFQSFNN